MDMIDPVALLHPFRTELWLPRYRAGRWGPWSMRVVPIAATRGYWGRVYPIRGLPALTGPTDAGVATWMSIVPMEMESQAIGIGAAYGHTAVMGLGMGWCAANVALNPAVERVTVVERDPAVVALIADLGVFAQLPSEIAAKIAIVEADAFTWRPDAAVDSLQIDIWPRIMAPDRWDDVRRMQDAIGAASLYFWGQELELWRLAARADGRVPDTIDRARLDALVASTALPLVLGDDPDLPATIVEAARWWTPRRDGWWSEG